jgi:uncharacterized protein (TIGR04562 family)
MREVFTNYDWSSLRAAVQGSSFLDVPKLNTYSRMEAKRFLEAYGYDLEDLVVREEIWRIYFEALSFLKSALLDPGESIPAELLSRGPQSDILRLMVEASKPEPDLHGRWACALLRVMHTISHLDNDVRHDFFQAAREQIFQRFDKFVQVEGGRPRYFGQGSRRVRLLRYQKKERKDRNSTLIKLLSKPTAMVEAIYDRLGFRFVTETKLDAVDLAQMFFEFGVICPANLFPNRAINTLVNLEALWAEVEKFKIPTETEKRSAAELRHLLKSALDSSEIPTRGNKNQFTSNWYKTLQFTSRLLVTAPDPTFRFWTEMKAELGKSKAVQSRIQKVPIMIREKRTFFYPFEIQIMDKDSYVDAIGGRSRHREYKAKQRLMARNRVLRDLI